MSPRGVVGMDRGVFEHELLKGEPYTRVQAWLWLVAEAAWKERRSRVAGAWVELDRAQLAHSLGHMARTWKWTIKRVRCFLARIAADGMIEIGHSQGHGVTVITVCNYDEYQVVALPKGTAKGTLGAHQGQQPEEGKKEIPDADAVVRARAAELTSQIYDIFGFDPKFIPPAWFGAQPWIEAGLRSGWKPDLVRVAARKVAARKKGGPPNNFRYLGPAIAQEHELAAAPMPISTTGDTHAAPQRELTLLRHGGGRGFTSIGIELARQAKQSSGSAA